MVNVFKACLGCTERYLGCHANCVTYNNEVKENEAQKKAKLDAISYRSNYTELHNNNFPTPYRKRRKNATGGQRRHLNYD